MKKTYAILLVCAIFIISSAQAQQWQGGGGDTAAMRQRMIERIKPQLIEKAKLTEAEADKVIEINFASRSSMRELRNSNLSEDERRKKLDEIQAANNKKYKDIPLTDEKVKAVNDFYAEQRRNFQQRGNN
ncbi:hypothetical protein OCK74_24610 [Chitinophagaceae bacterium LB-8]|uniref:DUF4890 domain-containing protein n=1 Tax=Paraflavisolibacter caeni TaxID=2982496 RepID=A0A9X2Y0E0_9BACT|nr:hypothetical protein [Paraflavisolibacter caeni]MCU7552325.1 hypothetical protein [Paraflavisolibacter caeni]